MDRQTNRHRDLPIEIERQKRDK